MLHIKHFNSDILTNINFHVKENENIVILGSNGAGKSTLAKVACGIIHSNAVELFGEKLDEMNAKKRAELINYIPPKLEVFDEYISLKEYLELSRLYSSFSVDEVISLLNLEELSSKACKTLSSGEQQLTMLASSILHNARVSIFDEPTANLDPKKTLQVYEILKSEKVQSRVVITHDLNLAHKLGYKILYIQNGVIEFFNDNEKFFEDSNLQHFFGESIKKIDGHFVVNL